MKKSYEETKIWRNAFSRKSPDEVAEKLKQIYKSAWERASVLSERISQDAGGLTLHNKSHFEALWKCADLILGPEYRLTPVEVFVFGVAVLIHDSAHTIVAYKGGLSALSKTPEWEDSLAHRGKERVDWRQYADPSLLPEDLRKQVIFDTVRALHAKEAKKILLNSFNHPSLGVDYYIIDDPTIRLHLGGLIGDIAASHHWDISNLDRIGRQVNTISPFNVYGPIRALLLGALMRTTDAIQIDASRAPDFEFALFRPKGDSKDHWTAQNRLAIGIDPRDERALVINSTVPFGENEVKAWWVAFQLAVNADRELRGAEQVLHDYGFQPFRLSRVKGVETPEKFSQHVVTEGWTPINAEVKIYDTSRIIEVLGGFALYGKNEAIPLRELIQNAIDAVRARRILDPHHRGRIMASLCRGHNSRGEEGYWLSVSDDGIGMSLPVLIGPLITFGQSGWSSDELRIERPGFLGKRFKHIGRYGIGFFSVFTIGKEVRITSRPFDSGASNAKTLHFEDGLGLRPTIKKPFGNINMNFSTTIDIFISDRTKNLLLFRNIGQDLESAEVSDVAFKSSPFSMVELLGVICPAIDVEIEAFDLETNVSGFISPLWIAESPLDWIMRITGVKEEAIPSVILNNLPLLDTIVEDGEVIGRASLNPTDLSLGVMAISGLTDKRPVSAIDFGFVGCLSNDPTDARRGTPFINGRPAVKVWASEQVVKWSKVGLLGEECNRVAINAVRFGGDPYGVANCKVDGKWHTLTDLFYMLIQKNPVYIPVYQSDDDNEDIKVIRFGANMWSTVAIDYNEIKLNIKGLITCEERSNSLYWRVTSAGQPEEISLLGCLRRLCVLNNRALIVERMDIDLGIYNGDTNNHRKWINGKNLICSALRLSI